MAQQLDERPGQVNDPEDGSVKTQSEPSQDYIDSGIADAERFANDSDGQDSAVDGSESNIQNQAKGQKPWVNNTGSSGGRGGLRGKKGKFILSALLVTIFVSIGGAVFLLPGIAVKSVMAKSTEFFMDRVDYATEKRVEKLIGGYFTKMIVGPNGSMQRCGTYISADCFAVDPGNGTVGNLYKNWREARLEERLNKRYGLEFTKNTASGKIEVWKKNAGGIRGQVGIFGDNTVTKEMAKLVKSETRWTQVRDRLGVRSLLAGRYGASKWCFIACDKKDSIEDIKIKALTRIKLRIASRVLSPVSAKQTAIILCLLSDCSDTDTSKQMRQAAKDALGGTDADITEAYRAISGGDVDRPGTSITQHYLSKFLEKVLTKFGVENATKVAFSAVPIAGQIYAGVQMADLFDRLLSKIEDKTISKHIREINESAYVDYFSLMQSSSDEVFSGQASLEEIGAMSTILSGSNKSRVYQKASGSQNLSTVECDDGVVLSGPTDPLACPEMAVQPKFFLEEWVQNPIFQAIKPFINTYGSCIGSEILGRCPQGEPKKYIRPILEGINWFTGGLASIAMGAIGHIPIIGDFVESVQNFVSDKIGDLIKFIAEKTFGIPVNAEAENQEAFDQLAAGMDVAANSFAKGDETEDGEVIGMG
jgi:hypothetical protein